MSGAAGPTVLVVGATGVFGRRLSELLAEEVGVRLILAGRTAASLEALAASLGTGVSTAVLDRDRVTGADLDRLGCRLVIDAAGPFQGSRTTLLEAAVAAGCHYVDLADGRDFVAGIARFDAAARDRGVAVLSGASSTPALSHAVADAITAGWRRIDVLRVAICPGNRAPRGLSVVRAILSYVGRPVRVFRDGAWREAPGWGLTRRIEMPGLGGRLASLCDSPDLDLLVERYRPRQAAEFLAGLELALLHRGLGLAGLAVRLGLLRSLAPLARPLRWLAILFEPFGSDRGGMLVEAAGQDTDGRPATVRWSLVAPAGVGPTIPTLPAVALVRRVRDGRVPAAGARPCVGELTLEDFEPDFRRLGVVSACSGERCPDVFPARIPYSPLQTTRNPGGDT